MEPPIREVYNNPILNMYLSKDKEEEQDYLVYETSFDKLIREETIKLKQKFTQQEISLLEKIIHHNSEKNPTTYSSRELNTLQKYYSTNDEKYLEDFLETTENQAIKEVDYLGQGVLGMYDPKTDSIYIVRGLTGPIRDFVIGHEKAHRRRAYAGESQNEEAVDAEARATTGVPIYR